MTKRIIVLTVLALSLSICGVSYAKDKAAKKEKPAAAESISTGIDTNDFYNSKHHWYDIYEAKNVINAEPNQPRYNVKQVKEIADNVLLYQKDNGGWPKNYDMQAILTKDQREKVVAAKPDLVTTFDNCTTYSHIKYLAKVYKIIKNKKYKEAALKGIDFVLSAQYANGGWPQYYPLQKNYSRCITFNDDAMTGIMAMFKDIIVDKEPYYSIVDKARRGKIKTAYDKGLECILKCQIKENGILTGWCQQHDPNTLAPAMARKYELPSICNREGTTVVLFLMSIDKPSKEVINSVQSAIKWFEDSKIKGIRVEEFNTPPYQTPLRLLKTDRRVVEDKNAPPIWARFYELGTRKPLFSNRQSQRFYTMAEVDRERRAYGWYTYDPKKALEEYPAWQKKWAPKQNVLKK
jgi:PelA/Pel-15E family pectate lyase